ncbi:Gfo/Idh/MocA family protein [Segetibacter koreensis]|uniref:Gfo/Idh/MocA family protein n=1 Tax=Segetibacter koreensis TaxID=398037 RepID=UPI0003750881|nr:Gfo/Idh/MocA family oxidoreductase [Segetibacter koreensis]
MKENQTNRRRFIKNATNTMGGMAILSALPKKVRANAEEYVISAKDQLYNAAPRIKFSVIGINHGHVHSQIEVVIRGGGQLVSFYAKEADLAADFAKRYPQAKRAASEKEILEDKAIHLIVSAAIPNERAFIGIDAMRHGKDFMVDKPGITTLEQLIEVRKVQKETGRIFSILYGRLESPATIKAGELVKAGAIGKVIQTIALAPHRMSPKTRPAWFFDIKHYGGIINDIGSHQFDEYLFFTGSSEAEIVASQAGNVNHPQYPEFEDFGDVMIKGNRGTGYLRVDWFTPDGLKTWGDDRLTILGTEGYIELRKNIDIAGREGGNHLFLVNQKETRYFNCSNGPLPYGELLIDDIINRTQTAMLQDHCFLATELALKAQNQAKKIKLTA